MQTQKGLEILISKKKIHEILISKIPKLHFLENQKSFCRKWKAFLLVSQVLSFRLINKLARCRRQPLTCLKIVSSIFMSLTGKKTIRKYEKHFLSKKLFALEIFFSFLTFSYFPCWPLQICKQIKVCIVINSTRIWT